VNEPPVKYRAEFRGRSDLSSKSFSDYVGDIAVGKKFDHKGETWRIAEIVPGEEGEPDLLVFERADDS
jgi:hypothetical protein